MTADNLRRPTVQKPSEEAAEEFFSVKDFERTSSDEMLSNKIFKKQMKA